MNLAIPEDIRPPFGSEPGTDIKVISRKAKKKLKLSIEAKNQASISIWAWLEQTLKNKKDGTQPVLIFKRAGKRDNKRTWAVIPFEYFLELLKNANRTK